MPATARRRAWQRSAATLLRPRASQEQEAAWELGVTATPALLFFWDGKPVTIHRSDWEGSFAFVGAASRAQLVELIRHTRDCCVECSDKGAPLVVGIDF